MPPTDSLLAWTLISFGFDKLFGKHGRRTSWKDRILVKGLRESTRRAASFSASRKVIPLTWIELDAFNVPLDKKNLYREEPQFDLKYTQFLRDILSRHGFVHPDAIDTFVRGILRELGWNAVLHSAEGKSGAFAAFAGQVLDDGRILQFALSDLGCGIIHNLRHHYLSATESGRTADYQARYSCNSDAAVLRYAFDPDSTSRSDFPAQYDLFSDRGLSLVAEMIRESGILTLASSGGEVTVNSTKKDDFLVASTARNVRGTTIYGELYAQRFPQRVTPQKSIPDSEMDLLNADVFPIGVILERRKGSPQRYIGRIIKHFGWTSTNTILDFGFADAGARTVENIAAYFLTQTQVSQLTLANCRSQRISPNRIARQLEGHKVSLTVTALPDLREL